MTNWTTNTLITSKLIADILWDETVNRIDFNRVSPMPKSLDIESPSNDYAVMYYLTDQLRIDIVELDSRRRYLMRRLVDSFLDTPEELYTALSNNTKLNDKAYCETLYQKGKTYVENYRMYGAPTWFEWCPSHWGTKWNAFDSSRANLLNGLVHLNFRTAWSSPITILEKLSKILPKEYILLEAHYDDGYYSKYQNLNGEFAYIEGSDITNQFDDSLKVIPSKQTGRQTSSLEEIMTFVQSVQKVDDHLNQEKQRKLHSVR